MLARSLSLLAAAAVALGAVAPALADDYRHHDERRFEQRHDGWHDRDIHRFHERDFARWQHGRWFHGRHDGRPGWWWDVGGVWYFYPQRFDGPPAYISEDYVDDVAYGDPGPEPVVGAYGPPPGAYPPPPPPPDPGAAGVGGAIVGGVLGGLLTGRASGVAAGAVIGGLTGATAAAREGYWLSNGGFYYRYPSGQYVVADPRWCY